MVESPVLGTEEHVTLVSKTGGHEAGVQSHLAAGGTRLDWDPGSILQSSLHEHDHQTIHSLLDKDVVEDPAVHQRLGLPVKSSLQLRRALHQTLLVLAARSIDQKLTEILDLDFF